MTTNRIVTLLALVCTTPAWAADAPASNSAAAPAAGPTQEQVMTQFRDDLQATAADVMAKGLTLTADQAAKFWPMFQTFQKEQKTIIDDQLASLAKYSDAYKTMSSADALAYVTSLLTRDQKIHDLRVKYLAKFQEVVPPNIAARAIQIDRRLGLVAQVKVSSQVPLVH
jgi:Spy/CpxP family protein refolding chaperone